MSRLGRTFTFDLYRFEDTRKFNDAKMLKAETTVSKNIQLIGTSCFSLKSENKLTIVNLFHKFRSNTIICQAFLRDIHLYQVFESQLVNAFRLNP